MNTGPAVTVVGRLAAVPPVRYATNGPVHLAYQQFGEGPVDLVGIPPIAQNIEVAWEHPRFRRLFEGLSSFSRYLHFDKRGTGLSDRDAGVPSLDERVDDLRAVLDHAGIERAHLCGVSEGGSIAALFAATYPERVEGVVLVGASAGGDVDRDGDDPTRDELVEAWLGAWGTDATLSPAAFTPSLLGDESYLRWIARYERQSASPGDIRRLVAMAAQFDVRDFLPLVTAPTLVLHRRGDQVCTLEQARLLAERIPWARLEVLDGDDHAPHAGDIEALTGAIRDFVAQDSGPPPATRMLATVVFTDIVRSTQRASELGDRQWCTLLDRHDELADTMVTAHGGRIVKHTGDGILAVFDGPARALRCATELRMTLAGLGLQLRAGLHAGEIERRGDDVGGLAVHIAARVQSCADSGDILVSRTVRDLVVGSDFRFVSLGDQTLRGVPGEWEVLALSDEGPG